MDFFGNYFGPRKERIVKIQWLSNMPEILIRTILAYLYIQSGYGKFQDMDSVVNYFMTLQIPWPHLNAYIVAAIELIGGAMIFIGLLTRFTSFLLSVIMVVALLTAQKESLSSFGLLIETVEFLYFVLLFALFAKGSVVFSIDQWLRKKFVNKTCLRKMIC